MPIDASIVKYIKTNFNRFLSCRVVDIVVLVHVVSWTVLKCYIITTHNEMAPFKVLQGGARKTGPPSRRPTWA